MDCGDVVRFVTGGHAELSDGLAMRGATLAVAFASFGFPWQPETSASRSTLICQASFGANAVPWRSHRDRICVAVTAVAGPRHRHRRHGPAWKPAGCRALAMAATHDLALWIMLAAVVAAAHGAMDNGRAALTFALALAQIVTMLT